MPVNAGAATPASATQATTSPRAESSTTSLIRLAIATQKPKGRNRTMCVAMAKQRPLTAHERQRIAANPLSTTAPA